MKLVGEDRVVPVHQTALEKFNDSNKLVAESNLISRKGKEQNKINF